MSWVNSVHRKTLFSTFTEAVYGNEEDCAISQINRDRDIRYDISYFYSTIPTFLCRCTMAIFCLQGCPDGHNHVELNNYATEQSFSGTEVALDAEMAKPMAIPRPMSRQKVSCMIRRYIFGYRDIRYFATFLIFDIDTIYRTVLTTSAIFLASSLSHHIVITGGHCQY